MNHSHRPLVASAVLVALMAGTGVGYWWARSHPVDHAVAPATASTEGRPVLYWYDPMQPDQHFDKPGKSPFMDMMLAPKYAADSTAGGVRIASGVRQSLGIRTVVARPGLIDAALRVPGTIAWDLREERVVSARVDAVVDRLYVRTPFEHVRAGQPLALLIAPEWSMAIAEARAAGQGGSASARALGTAAAARLRALGIPPGAHALPGGRIELTAPVAGVVSEIGVREGGAAPAGTLLFRINGTDRVWLEAAIPQSGGAGVGVGTSAIATVDAFPGETFRGKVEALLPQVDSGSRTQRARIVLGNRAGQLAPGMFAQIALRPGANHAYPLVPTDALIDDGVQARVIVQDEDGSFRPIAVQAGRSGGGMTQILSGLAGGEHVVASGQFLIDSEASLSGALERLNAGAVGPAHAQEHVP
jgi:Cu(I)/Ag(I) efflux system membrane fusion protein